MLLLLTGVTVLLLPLAFAHHEKYYLKINAVLVDGPAALPSLLMVTGVSVVMRTPPCPFHFAWLSA